MATPVMAYDISILRGLVMNASYRIKFIQESFLLSVKVHIREHLAFVPDTSAPTHVVGGFESLIFDDGMQSASSKPKIFLMGSRRR
jgi:hypothetical protein